LESLTGKLVGTILGYGYSDAFGAATAFQRENGNEPMTNTKKRLPHTAVGRGGGSDPRRNGLLGQRHQNRLTSQLHNGSICGQ
jgi:hypothetical protein